MNLTTRPKIKHLNFSLFTNETGITHGVYLRHGGVSTGVFSSLNVAYRGDDEILIQENRKRITTDLHLQGMISGTQVHGINIVHVKTPSDVVGECDGMITTIRNWGLMISHADCQAAIFYDPINKAIAAVHAGWRGQMKNIYKKTVEAMYKAFGTNANDLKVCISPSLGPLNSEFKNYQQEFPEEYWKYQFQPFYFDLWSLARDQLEECGIWPSHIEIAQIDTYANHHDYFSYRREVANGRKGLITGCHATVIALSDLHKSEHL